MAVAKLKMDSSGDTSIEYQKFFEQLSRTKSRKQRKHLVLNAEKRVIEAVVEWVYNFLASDIRLTKSQRNRLRKHRSTIRQFTKLRSEKRAKDFLIQKGGFAPSILLPILTAIASGLLPPLVSKNALY